MIPVMGKICSRKTENNLSPPEVNSVQFLSGLQKVKSKRESLTSNFETVRAKYEFSKVMTIEKLEKLIFESRENKNQLEQLNEEKKK